METLITGLTGILSALVLGAAKKATGAADKAAFAFIKPVQPLLVAALAVGLPMLANVVHPGTLPSADIITNAPASALVGIVARELWLRLAPKPSP